MEKTETITTHPSKTVELLTYADLVELVSREQGWADKAPQPSGLRVFRSNLKSWCSSQGASLNSLVAQTLGQGFTLRLNAFCVSLNEQGRRSSERTGRWAVTEVHRIYESLRVNQDLPSDFPTAMELAMAAAGLTLSELAKTLKERFAQNRTTYPSLKKWLAREAHPHLQLKPSVLLVNQVEQVLNLPEGTLAVRAFKVPSLIKLGSSQPIPYRVHQALLTKAPYYLKDLPAHLATWFDELAYWRALPTMRVYGVIHSVKEGNRWTKPASTKKHRRDFLGMVSWLCLPLPVKPVHEMTDAERWVHGKGMDPKDVTLSHILNSDLIWEYLEFRRIRQVNKTYTQESEHFIIFVNSLVNHPWSFVKAHDKFAPIFGQACKGEEWSQWVEDNCHQPILKLNKVIKQGVSKERQRHPDAAMKDILGEESPMPYLLQMVESIEANLPPSVHRNQFASRMRDLAMIRMLIEVPLRSENVFTMELGRHLVKDERNGLYWIKVPKAEQKNWSSPHCYDIHREYSEKTSQIIDRYLTAGRPLLKGYDLTAIVFLSGATGPKKKEGLKSDLPYSTMNAQAVYWALSKRFKDYFGVGIGANVFRHFSATSILKDTPGDYETASAVLNNAANTVNENYKHLNQTDGLRRADAWRERTLVAHQEMFGSRPSP